MVLCHRKAEALDDRGLDGVHSSDGGQPRLGCIGPKCCYDYDLCTRKQAHERLSLPQ